MAATLTAGDRKWVCLSSDAFPVKGNGVKDGDTLHIIDALPGSTDTYIFFDDLWEPDLRMLNIEGYIISGKTRSGVVKQALMDNERRIVTTGNYAEAALAGRLFSVANQATVATTAAMATTWTGLGIANPNGSGKNAVIQEFGWANCSNITTDRRGAIGLMMHANTGMVAALAIKCANPGAGASVMYADDGAALVVAPILERLCGACGDINGDNEHPPYNIAQIGGSIIVPPGRSVLSYTTMAVTSGLIFYFLWEEVDI